MWGCEKNKELPSQAPEFQARRALRGAQKVPCFWLRGIIPKDWVDVPPPPTEVEFYEYGELALEANGNLTLYGDASGGIHSGDARLRRVGGGIVQLAGAGTFDIQWMRYGGLPGSRQTTNRGEAWWLFEALKAAVRVKATKLKYITDSQYVFKGVHK